MKQRFETLDTFRGLVILNMIAYHFLYDVFVIFGKDPRWYQHSVVFAWQQFICCSFIILSGFVWPYGKKKNFKRGIFVNLLGFVITAFTLLFTPQEAIWFGILNFLGCAILLMFPVAFVYDKRQNRLHAHTASRSSSIGLWVGLFCSLGLFLLLRNIQHRYLGFYMFGLSAADMTFCTIPSRWYTLKIGIPFGFPPSTFHSSDYFPLLPWFFLYVFGFFLGRILENKDWFLCLAHGRLPLINWIGRKSIWIYLFHQLICYGLCLLLFQT